MSKNVSQQVHKLTNFHLYNDVQSVQGPRDNPGRSLQNKGKGLFKCIETLSSQMKKRLNATGMCFEERY